MRQVGLALLVIVLLGCQSAPTSAPATAPAETVAPGNTPTSAPSATPIPTSSSSTPTASPAQLVRRAGPICEAAFSALFQAGTLIPPFAVLKKASHADTPAWELAQQLPHLGSLSDADVQTVFCISETRTQTRTYADGAPAYQIFWDVRAISWPDGKVIGRNSFAGPQPSDTEVLASDPTKGDYPYPDFAGWVFDRVDHPDFVQFNEAVTALVFSPVSDLAVFGSARAGQIVDRDYRARIFWLNTAAMQITSAADGHEGMVTSLAFSPDGKTLASGGFDLFVKFWDVASSRLLGQVRLGDTPNSLTFSPDGAKLAVASRLDVAFIDVASMQIESSLPEASGRDLVYAPDGDHIYLDMLGSIKMIDTRAHIVALSFPDPFALVPTLSVAADGTVLGVTYESPERVDGFVLSPDGSQIASYTVEHLLGEQPEADNVRLALWDAKTGKFSGETRFSGNNLRSIEFSPAGDRLALGNGSEVWIWEATTWQLKEKLMGHVGDVIDLSFAPDGTRLLSAGSDGTIRRWSLGE